MANFAVNTLNKLDYHGKPRIYFTCHPKDFDKYFSDICNDIFDILDENCAIYYTPDMSEPIEDAEVQLGKMHIFVIPITEALLFDNDPAVNRALFADLAFAKSHGKPILPIAVENIFDETAEAIYSRPENFGNMQRLDRTAVGKNRSYDQLLSQFLEETLLDAKTIQKVQDAFPDSIFLSYRKKDCAYADELMRTIHDIPGFLDVGIWYDEFLPLGEDWRAGIQDAMQKSKHFTLLVTPNILEDVVKDGVPRRNFVMEEECPTARDMQIPMTSAEMVPTDRSKLPEEDNYLPEFIDAKSERFIETMKEVLIAMKHEEKKDDPYHDYLVGLAYFYGIGVEVNKKRGLDNILNSANFGCPEGIRALYSLGYYYLKAEKPKLAGDIFFTAFTCAASTPTDDPDLCTKCQLGLYESDIRSNQPEKVRYAAQELGSVMEELSRGDDKTELMIQCAHLLGMAYMGLEEYDTAYNFFDLTYSLFLDAHPDRKHDVFVLDTMANMATSLSLGTHYEDSLNIKNDLYNLLLEIYGTEENARVASVLGNIAATYENMDEHAKALETNRKALTIKQTIFGPSHPSTLTAQNNMMCNIRSLYEKQEANLLSEGIDLGEAARKLWSEKNKNLFPLDYCATLYNLALLYFGAKRPDMTLSLLEEAYQKIESIHAEALPRGILIQTELGAAYMVNERIAKGVKVVKKAYENAVKLDPQMHKTTIEACRNELQLAYKTQIHLLNKQGASKKAQKASEELKQLLKMDPTR